MVSKLHTDESQAEHLPKALLVEQLLPMAISSALPMTWLISLWHSKQHCVAQMWERGWLQQG